MAITLKLGKRYRLRNGDVTEPVKGCIMGGRRFFCKRLDVSWDEEGNFNALREPGVPPVALPWDVVEELPDDYKDSN